MKYLKRINSPEDLKKIPKDKLNEVCKELRGYITETINQIGGHLAPTLGAIEITTAVHYVFNAPKDKIVWDTGHQAYAHKVLTCLLYTSPSPRDRQKSRMPSSA